MLRVREQGNEVHVDVDGVAGHQQRVLLALSECQRQVAGGSSVFALGDVSIRAGASRMRIRMKASGEAPLQASAIYRCLRDALVERKAIDAGAPVA